MPVERWMRLWLVGLMCLTLLATACSNGDSDADALPTATPTATEPPPPAPVTLRPTVQAISIADDDVLTKRTGRLAMDQAAIDHVTRDLVNLLRAEVDDRNLGGPGRVADLAAVLLDADASVAAILDGLADPDNPTVEVDLDVNLGVDVAPRWAEATLDVTRRDGAQGTFTLVFAVDGEDWELVLAADGGDA